MIRSGCDDVIRAIASGATGGTALAPADVSAVVGDVVSLVRAQKTFRTVRVETDVEPAPPVTLPAPRLTQVLLNVVLNAGQAVSSPTKRWYGAASRSTMRPCGLVNATGWPTRRSRDQRAPGPPAGWSKTHRSRCSPSA